jgi:hypothetical protein
VFEIHSKSQAMRWRRISYLKSIQRVDLVFPALSRFFYWKTRWILWCHSLAWHSRCWIS